MDSSEGDNVVGRLSRLVEELNILPPPPNGLKPIPLTSEALVV